MTSPTDGIADSENDFLPIKLRSYQMEMFERSLTGNAIVVVIDILIPNTMTPVDLVNRWRPEVGRRLCEYLQENLID